MKGLHMHVLHPRLMRPFPCINKICGMYGNTMYYNQQFHVDGLVVFKILPDLGPRLGRYVTWMEGIPMYGMYSRLFIPYPCINKTCENGGKSSRATDMLYHNPHLPVNGLVVYKYYKILAHSFGGMWHGWRASTCMCCTLDL